MNSAARGVDGPNDQDDFQSLVNIYGIDEDTTERAQELIDEGLDEDDAVELAEEGL